MKIDISANSDRIGNFRLYCSLDPFSQKRFEKIVSELFSVKLKLKEQIPQNASIETINGFEHTNGSNLHVVQDQFDGVIVESKDRELLLEVKKLLEEMLSS